MDDFTSPFLVVPVEDHLVGNRFAFAILDKFPVTPGHALVIPRRVIATWWEATDDERADLFALVDQVKAILDQRHSPDGYNVGFNAGPAAGQTVSHLHLHVIPRHLGDMPDPRGGVRHVIPSKGNYLADTSPDPDNASDTDATNQGDTPELTDGLTGHLLPHLLEHLRAPDVNRIDIVVSFVRRSGLDLVVKDLEDALDRDARVRLLTTDYLGITEPAALERLLDIATTHRDRGHLAIKVFRDGSTSFHPKAWLFSTAQGAAPATFVGSSNLTHSGLNKGVEWNAFTAASAEAPQAFERLWDDRRAVDLTREVLDAIEAQPRPAPMRNTSLAADPPAVPETPIDEDDDVQPFEPHGVQIEALAALAKTREQGHNAGLVVMATGLGKTYLAAFDALELSREVYGAKRVLFVAHRKEILQQARDSFRNVMPEARMGMLVDGQDDSGSPILFASVQSLVGRLDTFAPDAFDYLVVDEFHHASANSYRKVIDHFEPRFLLGLTATPDRLDGGDILALCGDNEVFRCDLVAGIDRELLSPFRYHGVLDPTDYTVVPWRAGKFVEAALEVAVATEERAQLVYDEWLARRGSRTLAFCVTQKHADFMARWFSDRGVRAVSVHSGQSSAPRNDSVRRLEEGELDVLFSVDVFNEGFDVPAIDTVLMLRPTASPVIFLQQLGRGLRISDDKDHLTVIDLIGNHDSFLLKPRVLLSLGLGRTPSVADLRSALASFEFSLPVGCEVDFEVGVIDLLPKLIEERAAKSKGRDLLAEYVLSHVAEEGHRPTKVQVLRAGLNPAAAQQPWFEYLAELGALDEDEVACVTSSGVRTVLADLERVVLANMSKAYKPVTLRALLSLGALRSGVALDDLVGAARRVVIGDPRLVADARGAKFDPVEASESAWRTMWMKNPVNALSTATKGVQLFSVSGDDFVPTFKIPSEAGEVFDRLVNELVDFRLAKYLIDQSEGYVLPVSHSGGNPIIRFDRAKHPRIPEGTATPFEADGVTYLGDFRKIALNVARLAGSEENALHGLLRGWFGAEAGQPGTSHQVVLKDTGSSWELSPAAGHPNN